MLFIGSLRRKLSVIALTAHESMETLKQAVGAGVVGGAIYDAQLAGCAAMAKADFLYTWNLRHYQRLWPEIAERVRAPDEAAG